MPTALSTAAGKNGENPLRARRGGRVVTIVAIASLNRFRAQPIWEMSAYTSLMALTRPPGGWAFHTSP